MTAYITCYGGVGCIGGNTATRGGNIMIIERIKSDVRPGTIIPKPQSAREYRVVGWGQSRGEDALVYSIPTRLSRTKPSKKRIKISDFKAAYDVLVKTGEFTYSWFEDTLPDCAKDGSCNFTTIGGIFELLGEAQYGERGVYRRAIDA